MHRLEQALNHRFHDDALLKQALTHSSCINVPNNQRLEFLGDAVLGMIVAEMLYTHFPLEKEGDLARRQAALVRGETLARIARENNMGEHLILSASEEALGGRENDSNLEDVCEALIGALYLDGGLQAAKAFVLSRWEIYAAKLKEAPKDAKTTLQEWAQGRGMPVPVYSLIEQTGPAHAPLFIVQVEVKGHTPAQGQAKSKRQAEQLAAAELLGKLGSE